MILLSALEGGARILSSIIGISPYMVFDDTLGWRLKPGAVRIHKTNEFEATYNINNSGYRGKVYDKSRTPNTFRIVVLGDSVGFGWGVQDDETFSALLDKRLPGVEVINLSVAGYSTDQELLLLKKEGLSYQPDLVIVQMTRNDLTEIQLPFVYERSKPFFILQNGNLVLKNVPVESDNDIAKAYYARCLPIPFHETLNWNSYAYRFFNN
ncbi:MAG: SGNH/GDSL hydrolase family protein [Planctomycetota bacterium]